MWSQKLGTEGSHIRRGPMYFVSSSVSEQLFSFYLCSDYSSRNLADYLLSIALSGPYIYILANTITFLAAALQSVFPQTELGTFMSLNKRDKERQLQEVTLIVTGIRLFNKECGKGGEGIDDCEFVVSLWRDHPEM